MSEIAVMARMYRMMLDCLPKNENGNEIKNALLEQYNKVEQEGLAYHLCGVLYNEHHFNFEPLFTILKRYRNWLEDYVENEVGGSDEGEDLRKLIGLAERGVPTHIAQECCSIKLNSFYFLRNQFQTPVLDRTLSFYNNETKKFDAWFPIEPLASSEEGLGIDFFITVDNRGVRGNSIKECLIEQFIDDTLNFLSHLHQARKMDFIRTKEILLEKTEAEKNDSWCSII